MKEMKQNLRMFIEVSLEQRLILKRYPTFSTEKRTQVRVKFTVDVQVTERSECSRTVMALVRSGI